MAYDMSLKMYDQTRFMAHKIIMPSVITLFLFSNGILFTFHGNHEVPLQN